jgi:hypothetical protein
MSEENCGAAPATCRHNCDTIVVPEGQTQSGKANKKAVSIRGERFVVTICNKSITRCPNAAWVAKFKAVALAVAVAVCGQRVTCGAG